jgi:hypothetical protein
MTTDRETIDALLDDVIKDEDEADDLDEPTPFLMALGHVEKYGYRDPSQEMLGLFREADDRARTAIDLWMLKLVGYSVPEMCMMARRIALGVKPEVAQRTHEDDPAYAVHARALDRRARRWERRRHLLKQRPSSSGLADKEESEE